MLCRALEANVFLYFEVVSRLAHNVQGLLQVWNSLLVLPGTAAH